MKSIVKSPRQSRINLRLIGLLCWLAFALQAHADGPSAAHNLFTNLARSRSALSVTESTALVSPTLVRGMYAISDRRGKFVGFVNEAGTLFGDFRGFNVVSSNGSPPRPMGLDEAAALRTDIMNNIDYDKLVKVSYGNGGQRRIVMFSAVDCPYCKRFEDNMSKNGNAVNTTFYVVPGSLQESSKGGLAKWQAAARIWCAEDSGAAWKSFWATQSVPQPRQCRFDARTAELACYQLKEILSAAGTKIQGTPNLVTEDGKKGHIPQEQTSATLAAAFGPGARPQPSGRQGRWLAD